MPKFVATFIHTQLSRGEVEITAKSLEKATEIAEEMSSDQMETVAFDGDLQLDGIVPGRLPKKQKVERLATRLEAAALSARAVLGDIIRAGVAGDEDKEAYIELGEALKELDL